MTREEIEEICTRFEIRNYTINQDLTIDVSGDVYLSECSLIEIPLQFRTVMGNFDICENLLTSLIGCPSTVGKWFCCAYNSLKDLTGCPSSVGGDFYCHHNLLTSLTGCPPLVGGDFYCHHNLLTSLAGCPSSVKGDVYCNNNKLTNLEDCLCQIGGEFWCSFNNLGFDYLSQSDFKNLTQK